MLSILLLCLMFPFIFARVGNIDSNSKSCNIACEKTYPLHTYPSSEDLTACKRGCRLSAIAHFMHDGQNSSIVKELCASVCRDGHNTTSQRNACNIGCLHEDSFANLFLEKAELPAEEVQKVEEKPAEKVKKPVEKVEKPVEKVEKPVEKVQKPVGEEEEETPAEKLRKFVERFGKIADEKESLAAEKEKLAGETQGGNEKSSEMVDDVVKEVDVIEVEEKIQEFPEKNDTSYDLVFHMQSIFEKMSGFISSSWVLYIADDRSGQNSVVASSGSVVAPETKEFRKDVALGDGWYSYKNTDGKGWFQKNGVPVACFYDFLHFLFFKIIVLFLIFLFILTVLTLMRITLFDIAKKQRGYVSFIESPNHLENFPHTAKLDV